MVVISPEQTGRQRLLDAAAQLFVDQGYAGTTLRQIASAAGIKAGSIYHHFDSKDELFIAVLHDGIIVMLDAFETSCSALDAADPIDRQLLAHVHAHLSAVFENGPYTTAHVAAFFTAPDDVRRQVVPQRDLYEQRWNDLFKRLLPTLSSKDRQLRRLFLFGVMNASAEWFDRNGALSVEQLATAITDQFLNGVAT